MLQDITTLMTMKTTLNGIVEGFLREGLKKHKVILLRSLNMPLNGVFGDAEN